MGLPLERLLAPRSPPPRAALGDFPTPVDRFDDLAARLGIERLVVKRDDRTGDRYGGNKVRKLEFILGDARRRGLEDVWTIGSLGSNHVLATSLYARELGLVPHAIQYPEPVDDRVRDTLRVLSTAAPDLELVADAETAFEAGEAREREFREASPPYYWVPSGGSTPVGELGYVNAALELRDQIDRGEAPRPDAVVVPVGSGGTLAGLLCGCRLASLDVDLVGVRTAMRSLGNAERIAELAEETASLLADHGLEDQPAFASEDVTVLHGYVGDGYGEPTREGARWIDAAADHGLELDPTFTAKTVAALADDARFASETVLYWHTLNGVDLSERIERADVARDLPAAYRRFFDGS